MKRYVRAYQPGGAYFFTVVTKDRRPWLTEPWAIERLRDATQHVRLSRPFAIEAMVVLPDHLHAIWRLPKATPISRRAGG